MILFWQNINQHNKVISKISKQFLYFSFIFVHYNYYISATSCIQLISNSMNDNNDPNESVTSCSMTCSQLLQSLLLHPEQSIVNFNPALTHEHDLLEHPCLQPQLIRFNTLSGAAAKSLTIGIRHFDDSSLTHPQSVGSIRLFPSHF